MLKKKKKKYFGECVHLQKHIRMKMHDFKIYLDIWEKQFSYLHITSGETPGWLIHIFASHLICCFQLHTILMSCLSVQMLKVINLFYIHKNCCPLEQAQENNLDLDAFKNILIIHQIIALLWKWERNSCISRYLRRKLQSSEFQ